MTRNKAESSPRTSRISHRNGDQSGIERLSSAVFGALLRGNTSTNAVDMGMWDDCFEVAFAEPENKRSGEAAIRIVHTGGLADEAVSSLTSEHIETAESSKLSFRVVFISERSGITHSPTAKNYIADTTNRDKGKARKVQKEKAPREGGNRKSIDDSGFSHEQAQRARKLFAAVVLAALDDAIADDRKYGNGPDQIGRWARSRDGREVLSCAGIDPNERVVRGLMDFVAKGVRTSVAIASEAQHLRDATEVSAVFGSLKRA